MFVSIHADTVLCWFVLGVASDCGLPDGKSVQQVGGMFPGLEVQAAIPPGVHVPEVVTLLGVQGVPCGSGDFDRQHAHAQQVADVGLEEVTDPSVPDPGCLADPPPVAGPPVTVVDLREDQLVGAALEPALPLLLQGTSEAPRERHHAVLPGLRLVDDAAIRLADLADDDAAGQILAAVFAERDRTERQAQEFRETAARVEEAVDEEPVSRALRLGCLDELRELGRVFDRRRAAGLLRTPEVRGHVSHDVRGHPLLPPRVLHDAAQRVEGADMTAGVTDPDFESKTATPKKIGMVFSFTRELFDDSPIATVNLLSSRVAHAIGEAEDAQIINDTTSSLTNSLEGEGTASSDTFDDDAETLATLSSKIMEMPRDQIPFCRWLINTAAAPTENSSPVAVSVASASGQRGVRPAQPTIRAQVSRAGSNRFARMACPPEG